MNGVSFSPDGYIASMQAGLNVKEHVMRVTNFECNEGSKL